MPTAKTPIRLGRCPGWSESSQGAKVILLVLRRLIFCCAPAHVFLSLSEKLTEYGDEIKRLEDAVQQSRESGDEREKLMKREIELKVRGLRSELNIG